MQDCGWICLLEIVLSVALIVMFHTLSVKFRKLNKKDGNNGLRRLKNKMAWMFFLAGIAVLTAPIEMFLGKRITVITMAILIVAIYPFFEEVN